MKGFFLSKTAFFLKKLYKLFFRAPIFVASFLFIVGIGILLVYPYFYQGRIYPGIFIADVAVGGLKPAEARTLVYARIEAYRDQGVELRGFGKHVILLPTVKALSDPDLTYDVIAYNADASVMNAYREGRENERLALVRMFEVLGWRFTPLNLPMVYQYDHDQFTAVVKQEFGRYETPARDAHIRVVTPSDIRIDPEAQGRRIDMEQAREDVQGLIANFQRGPLMLSLIEETPRVTGLDIEPLTPKVSRVVAGAPYALQVGEEIVRRAERNQAQMRRAGDRTTTDTPTVSSERFSLDGGWYRRAITLEDLNDWFEARRSASGVFVLGFSRGEVEKSLKELREYLEVPAQDAKFEMRDGKVMEFQSSQAGQTLDMEETVRALEIALLEVKGGGIEVSAVVRAVSAGKETKDVNALGIKERLGVGESNFAGSPTNRRHNIQVGVDAVNGTLIAPGEEWSLLNTLGEINAAAGYLPELVIKGNRTIPEYGGGLCQIGTTAFRAALSTGVPITARRNHSYRVRYYEPAGMDATIYNPKPDFRFLNDTGNYLLWQARTEGDQVVFELWGTGDGRLASTTTPRIFNIVSPPPVKIIETTDLKPGEKKCTERPHSGADTVFTYTVIYQNGEPKEQEFKSHYRPWQEVCLVGVAKQEGAENGNIETTVPSPDAAGALPR